MFLRIENSSHLKIVNKIGLRIELCGTLKRIFSQELYEVFIFALCFLFDKHQCISLDEFKLNPYAFNSAIMT